MHVPTLSHMCAHMLPHASTCSHTHIHTSMHAHAPTFIYMLTCTHTHTHALIHMLTHSYPCSHTHRLSHTHAHTHTLSHTRQVRSRSRQRRGPTGRAEALPPQSAGALARLQGEAAGVTLAPPILEPGSGQSRGARAPRTEVPTREARREPCSHYAEQLPLHGKFLRMSNTVMALRTHHGCLPSPESWLGFLFSSYFLFFHLRL